MLPTLTARSVALCLGLAALAAPPAHAQCHPQLTVGPWTSIDGDVRDMVVFDRGGVPTVCVVGNFTQINGVDAPRAAWWRPATGAWGPMGTLDPAAPAAALPSIFNAACLFDDGTGETLFAASNMGVWKWDGARWNAYGGSNRSCNDIAVIPLGGVPRLVIATNPQPWDGSVRSWNGAEWSLVGNDASRATGAVYRLLDGAAVAGHPEVLAIGSLLLATSAAPPVPRTAVQWDGLAWSNIADSTGIPMATIYLGYCDMKAFDDGSPIGNTVYLVGPQGGQGGGVWRISGGAWERVPGSNTVGSYKYALGSFNDGTRSRPRLYAGGWGLHAWDGAAWESISPVSFGPPTTPGVIYGDVRSLATYQPSAMSRPILLIGGSRQMRLDGHVGVAYLTSCLPCPADFDHSGAVGVQDLLSYLQSWFARDPAAEFNNSPGIDLGDFFAFLDAWYVGCL